jgi:hypothetical protein
MFRLPFLSFLFLLPSSTVTDCAPWRVQIQKSHHTTCFRYRGLLAQKQKRIFKDTYCLTQTKQQSLKFKDAHAIYENKQC